MKSQAQRNAMFAANPAKGPIKVGDKVPKDDQGGSLPQYTAQIKHSLKRKALAGTKPSTPAVRV